MINYIFLGAPGVGKGTLAKFVSREKGIIHISTGDIFRTHIQNETKLGLEIKKLVSEGNYAPDSITNELVKERLQQPDVKKNGFILDGYPRTVNQADFLSTIIEDKSLQVVVLECDQEIIFKRLHKRSVEENRADDSKEAVVKRLEVYKNKTAPLVKYYEDKDMVVKINVESSSIEDNATNFYQGCEID